MPEQASTSVIVMIAYDEDFNGRNLMFVSSSEKGLYAYDFSTGKWEKILDKNTTRVSIDHENDYVYVGTIGDWYYKCWYRNGKWSWEHITIPDKNCPVAGFIKPDPYNPERLWIGTETGVRGSLYRTGSKERNVETFVAVGFWKNGQWYDLRISNGWAPVIAIVTHKEGEDPSKYIIETEYGIGAKIAFVPRPGRHNIMKTVDGGKTWVESYNGIHGSTVNRITYLKTGLRAGQIVVTCVSGTQITSDFGDSWEEGIDFTIGNVGYGMPGYAWGAASPNEKLEGKYDLLIATGYPPSTFTGNGVYAVDTESLKTKTRKNVFKRIVAGAAFDLVVVGDKLYVGSMDSGVIVVNLKTYETSKLECIPEDEAGLNIEYYNDTLLIYTIKDGRKDMDNYFFSDTRATGGVYIYITTNEKCTTVYKGKRVVRALLHGNELVLLTVEGKVIHYTNYVKDWEYQLPKATYSDMAIDWNNRIVFFSTFDPDTPGILYGDLDNLNQGLKVLEGLITRRVRCLLLVKNYLFVGTEGYSVLRFTILNVYRTITYTLTLALSSSSINTGETVTLTGNISPVAEGKIKILLSYNGSDFIEIVTVALINGKYSYEYIPQKPGTYVFKAEYYNSSGQLLAVSEEKTLIVSKKREKIKPVITISADKNKVKLGEEVKITGTITPPVPKAKITVIVEGPKGKSTYSITASKGKFSFTIKPDYDGTWKIYVKIGETPKSTEATSNIITIEVEKSKCIIATVAFGSELSPEVSFLRNFRDTYILSTFTGRAFYIAFNNFYYSWSPYVASLIKDSEPIKAVVRATIYPLIGILKLTAFLSTPLFNYNPEIASLFAGFIASTLIGLVYFTPLAYITTRKRFKHIPRKILKLNILVIVASLGLTFTGVYLANQTLTTFSTSTYVIALITLSILTTLNITHYSLNKIKSFSQRVNK